MHRIKLTLGLVLTVGIAQLASGCVAHAGVSGEVVVADPAPGVVYVAPGVWVVENQSDAIFYSDNYYWQRRGSLWYRSSYYNDGFVVVHARAVPRGIYGVRNHRSYVRYRGRSNARRRAAVRRHNRAVNRSNRARARDHRRARRANQRANRRDNRAVRRNNRAVKRNNRAVRRDHRDARRGAKRDAKRDRKRAKKRDKRNRKRAKKRDYRR